MHAQQRILRTTNDGPFESLGEQLRAVAKAGQNEGSAPDPRLIQLNRRASAAGGSEMVPTDGGFLVQPEFSRQILERVYNTGEIFKRCLVMPTGTNGLKIPQFDEGSRVSGSRLGGIEGYWENEGAKLKPVSLQTPNPDKSLRPTFNNINLVPKKITGFLHLTDELSTDSDAFETWGSYAFSQELMYKLEGAIVNGTGAGQPQGIMSSPALALVAPAGGQQAHTVVSQNINTMMASMWAPSYNSPGSIWLYNQQLLPQLSTLATIVGAAGSESKLWQWCQSSDDYDRLAGIPALMSEHCQVPGTAGDIILCDLSRYVIAMREQFRAEVSIHVLFTSFQNTFRFVMRVDGQPIDRSPVIPANGLVPTSPFVALAGR